MSMLKVTLPVTLTLEGPLLTQSSSPGNPGLDAVICRNHKDEACLPGTLISGKLRQAWEELENASDGKTWFQPRIDEWLGKYAEHALPRRKQLFLSDFVLEPEQDTLEQEAIRHRIAIDPDRGAVEEHQLVMIENPFISGKQYRFSGDIHFLSPDKDKADNICRHIMAGFKWFSQIGAMRTVGFGRVVKAELAEPINDFLPKPARPTAPLKIQRISLRIEPQYPFCIGGKLAENQFEPEAIISGGALLGSIATTWSYLTGQAVHDVAAINDPERRELRDNFSRLRISHAFPSRERQRPVVAPLSLVQFGAKKPLYDVAQLDGPCLLKMGKQAYPPDFAVDWKDGEKTLKGYPWPYIRRPEWGWAELTTELRVRTAIDRDSLRSADEQLFSYERIIPDGICWYAELDLSRIDEDQQLLVLAQLRSLLDQGIIALGKTKTPVKITFEKDPVESAVAVANPEPINDNQWIITLQTDTLLGSPEKLCETSGRDELEAMYKHAWAELSDHTLRLEKNRYFARQKFFGGKHRYKMAQIQNADAYYRPWLLTEAGSVFVLKADKKDINVAQEKITEWLSCGLPLSSSVCACYRINEESEQQWRQTPFIPQNGYGEIAVNMSGAPVTVLENSSAGVIPIQQITEKKEAGHGN
jgi:CRISPR/Cas system CSM-associated protein Csm3 (group 7 of RAMP superfamily)